MLYRIAVVNQMCIYIGIIVITVKNVLIDPVTLQPLSFLSYAADKQTDRLKRSTHANQL